MYRWLITLFLLLPLQGAAETRLPDLGSARASPLSEEQEYRLGRAWLRQLRGQVPLLEDPLVQEYVEGLVYRLASHSALREPDLAIVVVNNRAINAFAVPGGVVGLNAGLFLNAEREDEVAAVVAHELAHLSQQHFGRRLMESQRMNRAVLAAMLASLAVAIAGDAEAGMAGLVTSQAAAIQSQLAYSRAHEREADRLGMQTLVNAGMDPQAMASFFERMLREQQFSSDPPEFLLTHPVTESRISDARSRAGQLALPTLNVSVSFELVRARLLAGFLGTGDQAAHHFRQLYRDGNTARQQAAGYGLAIAHIRSREYDEARQVLNQLVAKDPNQLWYRITLAEVDQAAGQHQDAVARLRDTLALMPGNQVVTVMLARSLIQVGEPEEAAALLQPLLEKRAWQASLWQLAADAWGKSGRLAEAHLARGEYLFLNGQEDKGKEQLQYAMKHSRESFPLHTHIRARLKEMQKLAEEEFR